ncbi:MAG: S-layer homology domain-containing protein [Actinomycetota bacterium]
MRGNNVLSGMCGSVRTSGASVLVGVLAVANLAAVLPFTSAPAGAQQSQGFVDVVPGSFYADAVAWMVAEGVTEGTSATTFSPDDAVTRGQLATFLYRYDGAAGGGSTAFVDVVPGSFYADAVAWMVAEGVTEGTSATTFSPDDAVTRGQLATFLYRYDRGRTPAVAGPDAGPGDTPRDQPPADPPSEQPPVDATSALLPPGGGRATIDGVVVSTTDGAPQVEVTVETYEVPAGTAARGSAIRAVATDTSAPPLTIAVPVDGSASSMPSEALNLMLYDDRIADWRPIEAEVATIDGRRIMRTTLDGDLAPAASFDATGDLSSMSIRRTFLRVTEDAVSFLDRNLADPILRWSGHRVEAPTCSNPVTGRTVVSNQPSLDDLLLHCTEIVDGEYRVKIRNNRSVAFVLSYSDGAVYERYASSGSVFRDLAVEASGGRILSPGTEAWVRVPFGSAGTVRVQTSVGISGTIAVLEEVIKEFDNLVNISDHMGFDVEFVYEILSCATTVSDIALGASSDLDPATWEGILGCVETVLMAHAQSLLEGPAELRMKDWGQLNNKVVKTKAIARGFAGVRRAKDWTVKLVDLAEFDLVPDFDIKIGDVGVEVMTASLPTGFVGVEYFALLEAAGGTDPTAFDWTASPIPPGLNHDTGILHGTPTAAGTYKIVVQAVDPFTIESGSASLTLTISDAPYAGRIMRLAGRGDAYYADRRGDWHWIPDIATFQCLTGQGVSVLDDVDPDVLDRVRVVNDDPAACIDAPDGTIVVHADGDSYLVERGVLRHILDEATFECASREATGELRNVPRYWILDQPRGGDLGESCWDPVAIRGTIVVDLNDRAVYVDNRGHGHRIPDGGTFDCIAQQGKPVSRNYRPSEVNTLDFFEDAECVRVGPGDIVRHADDRDAYVVQANFTKRWLPDGTSFNCHVARGRSVVSAPRYYISDLASAEDYSRAESCGFLVRNGATGEVWFVDGEGVRRHVPDGWSLGCWRDRGYAYYQNATASAINPISTKGGEAVCASKGHFLDRIIIVDEPNGSTTSYVATASGQLYWLATTQAFSCAAHSLDYGQIRGMSRATFDQAVNVDRHVIYRGRGTCLDSNHGPTTNIGVTGTSLLRATDGTTWVLTPGGDVQYILDWEEGYACVRNHLTSIRQLHRERTGVSRQQVGQTNRLGDWDCWNGSYARNKIVRNIHDESSFYVSGNRRWYIDSSAVFNCLGGMANAYNVGSFTHVNRDFPEYGVGAVATCAGGRFAQDRLFDCGGSGSYVVDWWGYRHHLTSIDAYWGWRAHFERLYGSDGVRRDCDADFWSIRRGHDWS